MTLAMDNDHTERRAAAIEGIMSLLAEQAIAEYLVRNAPLVPVPASDQNVTHDKTLQRPRHSQLQPV